MRAIILASALLALLAPWANAHKVKEPAPALEQGGSTAAAEENIGGNKEDEGKGPLERAGAELDKALNKTIEVISNSALEFRVKNHLHNHNEELWRELVVTAREGEVTVEGEVDSQKSADRVLDIVKSTTGVRGVVNKLKIKSAGDASAT